MQTEMNTEKISEDKFLINQITLPENITALAENDGKFIAIGTSDGFLHLLLMSEHIEVASCLSTSNSVIFAVEGFGDCFIVGGDSGVVELFNHKELQRDICLDGSWIENIVAISSLETFAVASARSCLFHLGGVESKISLEYGTPTGMAISRWQKRLYLATRVGFISLNEARQFEISYASRGALRGLSLSPDDRYLTAAFQEGDVYGHEIVSGSEIFIASFDYPFTLFEWSCNAKWFAVKSLKLIAIYESVNGALSTEAKYILNSSVDNQFTALARNPFVESFAVGDTNGDVWLVSVSSATVRKLPLTRSPMMKRPIDFLHWSIKSSCLFIISDNSLFAVYPNSGCTRMKTE